MRKLILVTIALLLTLTGCGGTTSESSPSDSSLSEVESSASEEASQESLASESSSESESTSASSGAATSSEPAAPLTIELVIPEGYTLPRIGMLLEEKKICTSDEFIAATQNGDFSEFPLIAAQKPNAQRCFKLEGYLFPDTYDIYSTSTPDEIIRKILAHTEQKISSNIRAQIDASGYTIDEILAMASIIEKESFGEEQMVKISSVLHNRLNDGMKLQCDVTINYVEGAIKPFITGDIDRFNGFYNTFKCKGLPAGAICNPGLAAINAAINPEATDYFFFVTDSEKKYYYAATFEEHEKNVAIAMPKK